MNARTLLSLPVLLAAACFSRAADQTTYAVFEVLAANAKEVRVLGDSDLILMSEDLQIGLNRMAVPQKQQWKMLTLGLPYQFVELYKPIDHGPGTGVTDGTDYRNEYLNYDTLLAEYDATLAQYPHLVKKIQIGSTIQNRPMYAYRVYKDNLRESFRARNNIVITGTIHAREWISPSVVLHNFKMTVEELATTDTLYTDRLTDNCAIYFIPVTNPDGYIYTWTTQRLWRKNRRQVTTSVYGVDLNRNYGYQWGNNNGSSGNPSSETYRGTAPFSEPETQAVRDLSNSLPNVKGFIDYHSYGQHILWPWSYTTTPPPNAAYLQSVGTAIQSAIMATPGSVAYDAGQASTTLYISSGASKDWFFAQFGGFTTTIELRNLNSFELPTNQITPTQDENWNGFKAFVLNLSMN